MTTEVKRESEKRSFAELYTILGFVLACTGLMITLLLWISSGIHSDMNRMHKDFKSEHALHSARQDATTARIDLAYQLLYQNLKEKG